MIIESKSKLIMIGDSITDCERAKPLGEGMYGGIGKSYAGLVASLLETTCPEKRIRVINMGLGGNNIRDLKARWETDVINLKPDWLSILIGINDVWRQFDTPYNPDVHVYIEEYSQTLETLVRETLSLLKGLVLMTPFYVENNPNDQMRQTMDRYGDVVKKLAAKYNTLLIDTQAIFDKYLDYYHPYELAWDRIHPSMTGQMLIARAFLNAVGYSWT